MERGKKRNCAQLHFTFIYVYSEMENPFEFLLSFHGKILNVLYRARSLRWICPFSQTVLIRPSSFAAQRYFLFLIFFYEYSELNNTT